MLDSKTLNFVHWNPVEDFTVLPTDNNIPVPEQKIEF